MTDTLTNFRWLRIAKALFALLVLNAALSMTNWWPTPFVELDKRIAPEFILLWVVILLLVWRCGVLKPWLITTLTCAYLLLVVGRYFDTTAPALFGRNINLYWDAWQIPRVLWVSLRGYPLWVALLILAAIFTLVWLVFQALRIAIRVTAREAAPYALGRTWALVLTAGAVALGIANVNGVQATWPYVSKPVLPTYWRQAQLLFNSLAPGGPDKTLPPSPAFDSDLAALRGIDVNLTFIESYGMVAFDNPRARAQLAPSREAFAAQIKASGLQVVSAKIGSTTFAGGSELAHVSLLSGIDTGDPMRHDLLLTTKRPTLVSLFKARGYETYGFYPGLTWDWPEKKFYGFDHFIDGRALGYRGPKLGYWTVPDQFSIARFAQLHPIKPESRPRLTFFTSITSHMPFHPVPPYQPDWQKLLTDQPFDATQMAAVDAQKVDWLNMFPGYVGMIEYNYRWLAGWLAQPPARESIYIVLGDHQPAANVTGEGASWDVPVHIISARPELLRRFEVLGFQPGLEPGKKSIGKLFDLTQMLVEVFNASNVRPALVAQR